MRIGTREVGPGCPPLVIAEIGINHEGSATKAHIMIGQAAAAGAECVKLQTHVLEDEYAAKAGDVVPANADEPITRIVERCSLSEGVEAELKQYAEDLGLIYLSTPFSRAAVDRLCRLDVPAFKVGSGELSNLPLLEYIASKGKPAILSTGMHGLSDIHRAARVFELARVPFALLHCTSLYPTPYEQVRLGAIKTLRSLFRGVPIGISDHSLGIYTALGAVALGADIVEKHVTGDPKWPGPDVPISLTPHELYQLAHGARAIHLAQGDRVEPVAEEQVTARFALATIAATAKIAAGDMLSEANIFPMRPGTGEIPAASYRSILGFIAARDIEAGEQLRLSDLRDA